MTQTLHLSLKREYFEQIRDGEKWFEYRLCNDYWRKRLDAHGAYHQIVLTLGYPARDEQDDPAIHVPTIRPGNRRRAHYALDQANPGRPG